MFRTPGSAIAASLPNRSPADVLLESDTTSYTPATLATARRIATKNGVRYAYTGNVHDPAGGTTSCHQCGLKFIGRDGYVLTAWALTSDGRCAGCGAPCAGVFDGPPGTWGARRLPVRLSRFAL